MREIKFRGKQKHSRKWLYGDLSQQFGECYIFSDTDIHSADNYEVDPGTIGQFTGLRDKNGVEIYEGDILRGFKRGDINAHKGYVYFDEKRAGFYIKGVSSNIFGNALIKTLHRIQVIGNIHENAELLDPKGETA